MAIYRFNIAKAKCVYAASAKAQQTYTSIIIVHLVFTEVPFKFSTDSLRPFVNWEYVMYTLANQYYIARSWIWIFSSISIHSLRRRHSLFLKHWSIDITLSIISKIHTQSSDVTWAPGRLKSLTNRLFVYSLFSLTTKFYSTGPGGLVSQRASNAAIFLCLAWYRHEWATPGDIISLRPNDAYMRH